MNGANEARTRSVDPIIVKYQGSPVQPWNASKAFCTVSKIKLGVGCIDDEEEREEIVSCTVAVSSGGEEKVGGDTWEGAGREVLVVGMALEVEVDVEDVDKAARKC